MTGPGFLALMCVSWNFVLGDHSRLVWLALVVNTGWTERKIYQAVTDPALRVSLSDDYGMY